MQTYPSEFDLHDLGDGCKFLTGRLPVHLVWNDEDFNLFWSIHPQKSHEIMMHGKKVKTPRWQQAYGVDYHYTGHVNKALPLPKFLQPLLNWAADTVDPRLNGVLVNWYDTQLGHYIGKHRDSTTNLQIGAPIVTISFCVGALRNFRLRPWKGRGRVDFEAYNGCVFVMPWKTNSSWTHELPKSVSNGRRISVTIRAFIAGLVEKPAGSTVVGMDSKAEAASVQRQQYACGDHRGRRSIS